MLELQRHAMLMYTSCGWFFDEISGLETVQVIQYAARAMQLARELWHEDLEAGFVEHAGTGQEQHSRTPDGRVIYEKFVKPAIMTRETVGAHYAISSIFESYPEEARHLFVFLASGGPANVHRRRGATGHWAQRVSHSKSPAVPTS